MSRDLETKRAAQQTFSNIALTRLNDSIQNFNSIRNIDVSQPKGRLAYVESLMEAEENLLTIKNQINALRLLYRED